MKVGWLRCQAASIAFALGACVAGPTAPPGGTPDAAASPTISSQRSALPTSTPSLPASTQAVAIIDGNQIVLLNLDGSVRWAFEAKGLHIIGGSAERVILSDTSIGVFAAERNGLTRIGSLSGSPIAAVASSDGRLWAWSTVDSSQSGQMTSTLHLAGATVPERTILTAHEYLHILQPTRWTEHGLWVEHNVTGIGGRIPFDMNTGVVDLVDADTGIATRIEAPADCLVSSRIPDGTVACVSPRAFAGTQSVSVLKPGRSPVTASLPGTIFGVLGNLALTSDLVYIGSERSDNGGDHYATATLDASTGNVKLLVDGYAPALPKGASLLPDGSLLLARAFQEQGLWVRSPSGTITRLYSSGVAATLLA